MPVRKFCSNDTHKRKALLDKFISFFQEKQVIVISCHSPLYHEHNSEQKNLPFNAVLIRNKK